METRFRLLIVILFSLVLFGSCLISLFPASLRKTFDLADHLSLVPGLGLAALLLLGFIVSLLSAWIKVNLFVPETYALFYILAVVYIVYTLPKRYVQQRSLKIPVVLTLLAFGLLIVRLPFIHTLAVPQYSDSVEHYQIIHDLLHPQDESQAFYKVSRIFVRYYHFGYHALAASFAGFTDHSIEDTMLVLGQVLQVIIPLSLYIPVKQLTKNDPAAWMAVLLAGLAWRMPSFAGNWGKYPALTSLALLSLPLLLFHAVALTVDQKEKKKLLFAILASGIALALAHTRSLLLLVLVLSSWLISGALVQRRTGLLKLLLLIMLVLVASLIFHAMQSQPNAASVLLPYWRDGWLPTLIVLSLSLMGLKAYPRVTLTAYSLLILILAASVLPLPSFLHTFGYRTLLDRPFTQVSLYLPLSVLGGAGFGALLQHIQTLKNKIVSRSAAVFVFLLPILVGMNSLNSNELAPSACCQLVFPDDLSAFAWINAQLPESSRFLIAGNRTISRSYGVDGGLWIAPLTGYPTRMESNHFPFHADEFHQQICLEDVTHIYVGGTSARFSVEELSAHPNWYRGVYVSPGAYLFQVIGCD